VINTVEYWPKARPIDQGKRMESPERNPVIYGQLTFDKDGRALNWKNIEFSRNGARAGDKQINPQTNQPTKQTNKKRWAWDSCIVPGQRMKLNSYLPLYISINSKWLKGLTAKAK
jgi:hypothetical protein